MAAVLLLATVFALVGISLLTKPNLDNSGLEMLRTFSSVEAFRLEKQITDEITSLEDFARSTGIQESLQASQGQPAPGPNEIVFQDNPAAARELETLRQTHGQIKSAALVNKSGLVLALSPVPETLPANRVEQWDWLNQVVSTGDAFVAASFSSDGLTGAAGLHVAVPVRQESTPGEPLGVLYVVIDPTSLAFVAPAGSPLKVATHDKNGEVLIPSIDPVSNIAYNDPIQRTALDQMLEKPSGTAYFRSAIGQQYDHLYGYTTISELKMGDKVIGQPGWIVVPQQIGGTTSWQDFLRIIGIGAGILGIAILLITFVFSRPSMDLAYAANQLVEQDDMKLPIPSYAGGDAGSLANTLQRLAYRLRRQNEQLKTAVVVSQKSLIPNLDELLDSIVQTLGEEAGYRGVGLYVVVDPGTQRAYVRSAWGTLGDGSTRPGDHVIIGKSTLAGRALLTMKVQHDDGKDYASFAGAKLRYEELVVPFVGKVPGALQLTGNKPHHFSEGDIDILRLIAYQIGFILENRQMLSETMTAKEEAEKANRVKSQFLANMSHELRTPLNAILNFTGFVMDGDTGPVTEEQVGLLTKVYQSGEHLLNLINDILDLSKIEADMMQFLVEEVDLNQILISTASVAKGLIKDRNIEFGVQIEEHLPLIQGDKRRLRQVFLNLISNAVKFTREGSVTLEAYKENGGAHICVTDTGTGIAPEDRPLVFAAFQQGQHNYEVSGTGLGLAISKHFVEAHGGKIWFESEVGVGTTFHVTLPTLGMGITGTSTEPSQAAE